MPSKKFYQSNPNFFTAFSWYPTPTETLHQILPSPRMGDCHLPLGTLWPKWPRPQKETIIIVVTGRYSYKTPRLFFKSCLGLQVYLFAKDVSIYNNLIAVMASCLVCYINWLLMIEITSVLFNCVKQVELKKCPWTILTCFLLPFVWLSVYPVS